MEKPSTTMQSTERNTRRCVITNNLNARALYKVLKRNRKLQDFYTHTNISDKENLIECLRDIDIEKSLELLETSNKNFHGITREYKHEMLWNIGTSMILNGYVI